MKGYSAHEVAAMLGLSVPQIRSFARAGFLDPGRGTRGEYRFSFHDLVLLRAAKSLDEAKIPTRKITTALRHLRQQLPTGRPLSAVRIATDGERVIVRDGDSVWRPDSGQALLDFSVGELAVRAEPLTRRAAERARANQETTAEEWYELGCELEMTAIDEARDAYRRAIELNPRHSDAHLNLGRLLHEGGSLAAAEAHYRVAVESDSSHSIAWFNLGVVLEDLERPGDAVVAYEKAIEIDPFLADAHYNVAGLYELTGSKPAALRHLKAYKKLVDEA